MEALARKDGSQWPVIESAYSIIKSLEDGCSVRDIHGLLDLKIDYRELSTAVSHLILADNAPCTSDRDGLKHTNIRCKDPLPEALYAHSNRPKRAKKDRLEGLDRTGLLRLKMEINKLLETGK